MHQIGQLILDLEHLERSGHEQAESQESDLKSLNRAVEEQSTELRLDNLHKLLSYRLDESNQQYQYHDHEVNSKDEQVKLHIFNEVQFLHS